MKRIKCTKELMIEFLFEISKSSYMEVTHLNAEDDEEACEACEEARKDEPMVVSLALAWGQDVNGNISDLFAGWVCGKGMDLRDQQLDDFVDMVIEASLEILHGEPNNDSQDSKG